jgi:hypothetical protein
MLDYNSLILNFMLKMITYDYIMIMQVLLLVVNLSFNDSSVYPSQLSRAT